MLGVLTVFLFCAASPTGQIAYVSGGDAADRGVHVLDLATGEDVAVGPGTGAGAPHWSDDGAWLAFESRREGGIAIFVVRPDGSDGRYLPNARPWNRGPAWSPDASKLAYVAGKGADRQIVVYDFATQAEVEWGGPARGLMQPVWLSQAEVAAALASVEGLADVGRSSFFDSESNASGALIAIGMVTAGQRITTDLIVVTQAEAFAFPTWALPSPDGTYAEWAVAVSPKGGHIAFESDDGGDREIFILTDRGAHDVSNHRSADWNPVWSPDGKWIAFESFREGPRAVYRVHRDTNRVFPVAQSDTAANWAPSWSPDGRWLVHVSNRNGSPDLFVTGVTGKDSRALTDGPGEELAPAWRPGR